MVSGGLRDWSRRPGVPFLWERFVGASSHFSRGKYLGSSSRLAGWPLAAGTVATCHVCDHGAADMTSHGLRGPGPSATYARTGVESFRLGLAAKGR